MFRFPDDYNRLEAGQYDVGLSEGTISKILAGAFANVKREYLYASFPRHAIQLGGCLISKRLITASFFQVFVGETGFVTDAEKEGWGWTWDAGWKKRNGLNWKTPFGSGLDRIYFDKSGMMPVMQTSWNDARAFCEWMSRKSGRGFRLPSEAEWETWAAGNPSRITSNESIYAGEAGDYLDRIIKICRETSDECPRGVMWEWTQDWYDSYPGGMANRDFGTTYKVLRGGSLMSDEIQKLGEYRFRRCPTARSPFYGFRICADAL